MAMTIRAGSGREALSFRSADPATGHVANSDSPAKSPRRRSDPSLAPKGALSLRALKAGPRPLGTSADLGNRPSYFTFCCPTPREPNLRIKGVTLAVS